MFHKDARALTAGMRRFTADLYHRLASGQGNLFFSPLSIATALLLVHAGARGETRREIEQALGFDLPEDRLIAAYLRLSRELAERNRQYDPGTDVLEWEADSFEPDTEPPKGPEPGDYLMRLISTANIWLQQSYPCNPDFLRSAKEVFDADSQQLDFAEHADQAADTINSWVRDQTEGRIEHIISPDMIDPLTRLVLASATYFRAGWLEQFSPERTETAEFHRLDGNDIEVPMMDITRHFAYARHDGYQIAGLPYATSDVRFVIVLPDAGRFKEVEDSFDAERLDASLFAPSEFDHPEVHLRLPRFRLDAELDLVPHLRDIGIRALFGSDADLTGISSEPGFHVSQVLHSSYVSVDEEGTEAAAATVMAMVGLGVVEPQVPIEFTCDRPFLFFITDFYSQSILFAGRLLEPVEASGLA